MSRGPAHCYLYRGSRRPEAVTDLAAISDLIQEPNVLIWFDIVKPQHDELELIKEEFGLHPLAIEDAIKAHERAKIESYGDYVFLIVHGASLAHDALAIHEVAIFAGQKFVVTVRAEPEYPFAEVVARWHDPHGNPRSGSAALLHAILDTIVDGYAPLVARYERRIDELEAMFFRERRITSGAMLDISSIKKDLGNFRRAILPMREILAFPLRGDDEFFTRSDIPYFRDVHDHVLLALDQMEWTRDLVNNMVETQFSIATNRQNEVAKQLTVIATIFLPLTFITGFFGQNFDFLVEGIKGARSFWTYGIGTEVLALGAMLVVFKRRGWF